MFISATYTELIYDEIKKVCESARMIKLKDVQLYLPNIHQRFVELPPRGKPEFVADIYSKCDLIKTIIFINTKSFALTLKRILEKKGFKAYVLFGGDMSAEERTETVDRFRDGRINVLLTTNLLARGLDVPDIQMVVNFDIPKSK